MQDAHQDLDIMYVMLQRLQYNTYDLHILNSHLSPNLPVAAIRGSVYLITVASCSQTLLSSSYMVPE